MKYFKPSQHHKDIAFYFLSLYLQREIHQYVLQLQENNFTSLNYIDDDDLSICTSFRIFEINLYKLYRLFLVFRDEITRKLSKYGYGIKNIGIKDHPTNDVSTIK